MAHDDQRHPLDVFLDQTRGHNPGVRTNHVAKDKNAGPCPRVELTPEEDAELQALLNVTDRTTQSNGC